MKDLIPLRQRPPATAIWPRQTAPRSHKFNPLVTPFNHWISLLTYHLIMDVAMLTEGNK
jgi:hypothetical protein